MQSHNYTTRVPPAPAGDDPTFLSRLQVPHGIDLARHAHLDPALLSADQPFSVIEPPASDHTDSEILPSASFDSRQHSTPRAGAPSLDTPGKTRVKSSKACDECRKRKIRCSATDDPGGEPCSHCKRTNASCTFIRQQLKRGPSKGYIKELNDRVNNLEHQTVPERSQQLEHANTQSSRLTSAHERHEGSTEDIPREAVRSANADVLQLAGSKRTHAEYAASHDHGTLPLDPGHSYSQFMFQDMLSSPQENSALSVNSPTLTIPSALSSVQAMIPNMSTQIPFGNAASLQSFFRIGSDLGRLQSLSTPYDDDSTVLPALEEWDDEVLDEYYRLIHKTFPILPHSRIRLRARLSDCPSGLRHAFLIALACLMRTFPIHDWTVRPTPDYSSYIKRAAELLASYPFESPMTHTNGSNLVYLQTLIIMALESDNHGSLTVLGRAGPSRAEWLGRAAGVAGQSEIHLIRPRERFSSEGDPDSDERIARRVWWSLFILDRWHASSTVDLLRLPENSSALLPDDQILLGESTYHLVRLSFIIGHLSAILATTRNPSTNVMASSNPASQLLGLTLVGEIDRFRESVESVWGSLNLVHLSYHHCHLLIKRLSPTTGPEELIDHAVKVATILNQRQTPITPLNHHFAALSAMTLCELADIPCTKQEARRGLAQLAEALDTGRGLAGHPFDSAGWDNSIRKLVVEKTASFAGQLVDDDAGTSGSDGIRFDPTGLTRHGYLTALGQGWCST